MVCNGDWPIDLDGSVVNATSGTWSNGTGTISGTWPTMTYVPSAAEINAGDVSLVLTTVGNNGCPPDTYTVQFTIPNKFVPLSITSTDALCSTSSDGTASVVPSDGPFTYTWDDPAGQTAPTATGLAAGTYTVVVADALGCDTALSIQVNAPSQVAMVSMTPTPESCLGDADGTLTALATGGTAPYTYTWSNGSIGNVLTATAGTYRQIGWNQADFHISQPISTTSASKTMVVQRSPSFSRLGFLALNSCVRWRRTLV